MGVKVPACEICGAQKPLVPAMIEGVKLNVCPSCASLGPVVVDPTKRFSAFSNMRNSADRGFRSNSHSSNYSSSQNYQREPVEEMYEFVVPNAGQLIKSTREKMGLKQIDLSRKLNIAESVIQQIESGHAKPTMDVIKKFEGALNLKLIVSQKMSRFDSLVKSEEKSTGFTIGDFMVKKK